MSDLAPTVNQHRTTSLSIHVPAYGAWRCDVDFNSLLDADALTGQARVAIGASEFVGAFVPRVTGSFQLQSKARVVAGAAAMGHVLRAKHYHSDSGIYAKKVAADVIREAGETAGASSLTTELLGVDMVRWALPAAQILDQILDPWRWWVDYDGLVQIGLRTAVEITAEHEVLDYNPRTKLATISCDDPKAIAIGSVIRQRVVEPLQVHDLEIAVGDGKLRVTAFCTEVAA